MTLKIIGAGYGRTGTLSLKLALETLGYQKCYHMTEVARSMHFGKWNKKLSGEDIPWEEFFQGYQATVDWPTTTYYKELASYYPDAKVILTVRDFDKWYLSMMNTIYAMYISSPKWISYLTGMKKMMDNMLWDTEFQGKFENKEHTRMIFEKHIEEVKRIVPNEKLLIFNVSEGWEPLCSFLDVSVPDIPFPRTNETAKMQRNLHVLKFLGYLPWGLLILIIFTGLYYA